MLFYDTGFKVLQVAVRLCRIRTQNFTFLGGGVKTVELTLYSKPQTIITSFFTS